MAFEESRERIPPRSVVRLVAPPKEAKQWVQKRGLLCRIGYYSRQDGLDVVWIVDQFGEYVETMDQESVYRYFERVETSDEDDFFGDRRSPIGKIPDESAEWKWSC